jgi:hypothetical protein
MNVNTNLKKKTVYVTSVQLHGDNATAYGVEDGKLVEYPVTYGAALAIQEAFKNGSGEGGVEIEV